MSATTTSSPLATLAGTASSQPLALWQGVVQANAPVDAGLLNHWTAAEGLAPPRGQVFWLPTPASASAQERALEQHCRQQLMQDAMDGHTSLRVLYGAPAQQLRALRECLQLLAQEARAAVAAPPNTSTADATTHSAANAGAGTGTNADSTALLAAALQHGHAPSLRCRDCVDPTSEQRLFSRLLAGRADPARGTGPR